jgi:hypothetical protein
MKEISMQQGHISDDGYFWALTVLLVWIRKKHAKKEMISSSVLYSYYFITKNTRQLPSFRYTLGKWSNETDGFLKNKQSINFSDFVSNNLSIS